MDLQSKASLVYRGFQDSQDYYTKKTCFEEKKKKSNRNMT